MPAASLQFDPVTKLFRNMTPEEILAALGLNLAGAGAPRVVSVTLAAEPVIDTDLTDIAWFNGLNLDITNMSTNLTGTPVPEQKLIVRILSDGSAHTINWGASFAARGAALPVLTIPGTYLRAGFLRNEITSTWDCVAAAQG